MPKMLDIARWRYDWLPGDDAIADRLAPTVAELTASDRIELSDYMVTTSTVNPTASDTVDERAISDASNSTTFTLDNYEGSLVLFRSFDEADGTPDAEDLYPEFTKGKRGWVVRRAGKPSAVEYDAADIVDVFRFQCDNPQANSPGEGYLKITVPLSKQGAMGLAVPVTSG